MKKSRIIICFLFSICGLNDCMAQEISDSVCTFAYFYTKDSVILPRICINDSTIEDSCTGGVYYIMTLQNDGSGRIEDIKFKSFFLGTTPNPIVNFNKTDDIVIVLDYYIAPILLGGYCACNKAYQSPVSRLETLVPFSININNSTDHDLNLYGSFFAGRKTSIVKAALQQYQIPLSTDLQSAGN